MSMVIKPKNWKEFQHYKDRNPPWIKLHKSLLDNYEFQSLQLASKALAPCYWLLASEHSEGHILVDSKKLAWRFRCDEKTINDTVKELISSNFFELVQGASSGLANGYQNAMPEESRGETETEGEKSADTEFKISLSWRPSNDAYELIKIARGRLPEEEVINKHLANFVGYWRTRDTARRQDQWDHAFADWVNQNRAKDQQAVAKDPADIFINVLGQQIDITDRGWVEWFRDHNDADTPEALRIDREATRAARKQVTQ